MVLAVMSLAVSSRAANEAMFSASSEKTNYNVGDDITVTLNVDAGPYASSLSVIDFDLKVSDMTVVEPKDKTSPFVPGQIFSNVGMQSVQGDKINIVCYINPNNKPAKRSGVVGTISFKALKEGSATLSYERIEAAEENKEMEYVSTSASNLVLTIGAGSSGTATPTPSGETTVSSAGGTSGAGTTGTTGTTGISAQATKTKSLPAVQGATSGATSATTGPEAIIAIALLGGGGLYAAYKLTLRKVKKS